MAVSAMDTSAAQALRAQLEALDGVERAVVDETNLAVLIQCEPDASPAALRSAIDTAIAAAGLDPEIVQVNLLTDLAARRRVKFAGVERQPDGEGRIKIRVALEWSGDIRYGEASGESGDLIELRTAAAAALDALEHVLDEPLGIKLVGVKQVKAFDAELMVVALYRSQGSPQRLVGSVSAGNDPRRAAAVAVLNALNRVLGNYLIVRE